MHKSITLLPAEVSLYPGRPAATQEDYTAARAGGLGTPALGLAPGVQMTERIIKLAGYA